MKKENRDIDTQIVTYVGEKGLVRTGQVVNHFARTISKESVNEGTDHKKYEETKKSKRTIQRRIEKLTKNGGPLVRLNPEQAKRYGKEDPDGRSKYLTLREMVERTGDLDEMFKLLDKGNDHDKEGDLDKGDDLNKDDIIDTKMVLHELKRYEKRYVLYPSQLDILVQKLDSHYDESIDSLLYILYNYVTKKDIKPSNKDIFLEKLRSVLDRYQLGHIKYTMLRRHVIWLLGIYDDETIFEQIKRDIKESKLSDFKNDYFDWFTAKAIEKRRKDLFNLERELRKEGDKENADILREIRDKAEENIDKPIEEPDECHEAVVGSKAPKSKTQKNIMGIKK